MPLLRAQEALRKSDTPAFAFLPNAVVADPPHLSPFEWRSLHAVLVHTRLHPRRPATVGRLLHSMMANDRRANADRLDAALARLQMPIGSLPPVLTAIREDGTLEVDPFWKPEREFTPVPVLPPSAIRLWLFLLRIDKGSKSRLKWIRLKALVAWLGIHNDHPRRSLQKALRVINRHLQRIDRDALAAVGVKLPCAFGVTISNGDRVTFVTAWEDDDFTSSDHVTSKREDRTMTKPKRKLKGEKAEVANYLALNREVRERQFDEDDELEEARARYRREHGEDGVYDAFGCYDDALSDRHNAARD